MVALVVCSCQHCRRIYARLGFAEGGAAVAPGELQARRTSTASFAAPAVRASREGSAAVRLPIESYGVQAMAHPSRRRQCTKS